VAGGATGPLRAGVAVGGAGGAVAGVGVDSGTGALVVTGAALEDGIAGGLAAILAATPVPPWVQPSASTTDAAARAAKILFRPTICHYPLRVTTR
jgi:hypothetical protein